MSLQNALALNTPIFSNLGTFRNFYAHRNSDTWRKAKRKAQDLGIFGISHVDDIVLHPHQSRPVTLYEDWADDAELFFDFALS